jgi:hypothetical protein
MGQYVDSNIQCSPISLHFPNDGSNIGGKQPANAGAMHGVDRTAMALYVEGEQYATIMAYFHRLMPTIVPASAPQLRKLQCSADVFFDSSASLLRLFEFDTMLGFPDGTCYGNLSAQILRGQVQVVRKTGPWVNVQGATVAWPPAPGKHYVAANFAFDPVANSVNFVDFTWDLQTFPVGMSSSVNPVAWAPGPSAQAQITLDAPGAATVAIDNWNYVWSTN